MRNKMLGALAAGLMLAATVAGVADAGQAGTSLPAPVAKVKYFKTTVTPNAGVTSGTTLTLKGTGAKASTAYYCLVISYSTRVNGLSAPDRSSLKVVKSTSKGKVKCKTTYHAFKAKDGRGATRHCPTTATDRKAGFKCGVALADQATVGALSASVASFKPKK